jgi:hypothetical protein
VADDMISVVEIVVSSITDVRLTAISAYQSSLMEVSLLYWIATAASSVASGCGSCSLEESWSQKLKNVSEEQSAGPHSAFLDHAVRRIVQTHFHQTPPYFEAPNIGMTLKL